MSNFKTKEDEDFSVLEQIVFNGCWNFHEGSRVMDITGITAAGRNGIAQTPAHKRYTMLFHIYMVGNPGTPDYLRKEYRTVLQAYFVEFPNSKDNLPNQQKAAKEEAA
jgi:predicted alternative tryptophan synthase beta-subunit